ncbi:MAG: hypothetical protein B7Y64_13285 [Acidovorax sp. 35-64-16]|nr:MAG: hypothetical protein B7Y64_13285 [Acidovorax sp. 35-64-16]
MRSATLARCATGHDRPESAVTIAGIRTSIDVDSIIKDLGDFMVSYAADDWSDAYHHDFQYEVERVVERLSVMLRNQFGKWIRQLVIPTRSSAGKRLQSIDANGIFLTFNYTGTLREGYAVPDAHVLHIHGCADLEDDDLILGHAWNPQTRKSLNDREDIEEIDTRLMEANHILDTYFAATFKPSDQLIQRNRQFFDGLFDIQEVWVLGHSLSDVDEPYFKALLTVPSVSRACWSIACRSASDGSDKQDRLQELGVDATRIFPTSWDEM